MAFDKVVDSAVLDAGMKSVADAIRAKAGTTDLLSWPDGFKSAVDNITGGIAGAVLLESGEFTLAEDTDKVYTVELNDVPDLFVCYAETPETDTSSAATDGAFCMNMPSIAGFIKYNMNYVTNINYSICWYTYGVWQLVANYAWVSTDGSGTIANIKPRSSGYKLKAKTYKWEAYKIWE